MTIPSFREENADVRNRRLLISRVVARTSRLP